MQSLTELNFKRWTEKATDKETARELKTMTEGDKINAFYKYMDFGTGGLRGEMGAGTNCMNVYTVRKATQGVCDYMAYRGERKVAISYDSRINSYAFAKAAAEVFALNGIETYIVEELMPTPFLSFAVRELRADKGVMITASHNPATYNGYKVYEADGCQAANAVTEEIAGRMAEADEFLYNPKNFEDYIKDNKIKYPDRAIASRFIGAAAAQAVNEPGDIRIAYTPLNGAGYKLVPLALKVAGFDKVDTVEGQNEPDGRFPTCPFPNPEKKEALELGLKYAEKRGSDILLATDPDCDRVGVAVKQGAEYIRLTGNEVGALLADYIFFAKGNKGILPKRPVVIKTIVTSDLGARIAADYGAEIIEVLTGFKYIGQVIGRLEADGREKDFVLGYEESCGYLVGSYVRDKDAVSASILIAEMAAFYLKSGRTLWDRLEELYQKYGRYRHELISYEFKGAEGHAKIKAFMETVRNSPPAFIGTEKVIKVCDYLLGAGEPGLPKSNVLRLDAENGTKLIMRPSGTEPLIKFYLTSVKDENGNAQTIQALKEYIALLMR